jgi:aspartyl-tRNA(Asn)/glutamyl-tRNA(Gln) amidotransferase subunit A
MQLYDLTIAEASKKIQTKELSPVELTQSLLDRIESLEPKVQAWVTVVKEEALHAAKEAEKEIFKGKYRGPLHGIPYGAKDSYYTAGIRTTAGSNVNGDFVPEKDGTIISRLKDGGAVLLGKTTQTEYAFPVAPPSTRNPWNLEHTPGASSSGSSAGLAASMMIFSLGTQAGGSLSRPAAYNALTTLKPTYGRVSREGIITCSWSIDHPGAFTRTVEDTALILQAIAGYDPLDPTTLQAPVPNYLNSLVNDVKGMVLGVPDSYFFDDIDSEVAEAFEESIKIYQELGAKVVSVSLPEYIKDANKAHGIVMRAEFATYIQKFYDKIAEVSDPALIETVQVGLLTSAVDYLQAQRVRTLFRTDLVNVLNGIDAMLTPATPTPPPKGISFTGSPVFNVPFSNSGVPTLTFPNGFTKTGLPLGLQLVARPLGEETLIRLGYAYQCLTHWHEARPDLS